MPRRNSSPPSSLVDRCFFSMEEVNEVSRKIGQEGEFRQLGKGRVSNRWRLLHLGRYLLTGWSALQGEVGKVLRNGSMSPEEVSHLLSRFLDLMAAETEKREGEVCIGNGTKRRIARRAKEYIEEHYPYTIRLEDLCRSLGVSLRTLQRSFSEYFQVNPTATSRHAASTPRGSALWPLSPRATR